jgi:hypothetical protein
MVLGVPMPFLLHNLPSVQPMPNECSLATHHLRQFGCKVEDGEIKDMDMRIMQEQGVPTWTDKVRDFCILQLFCIMYLFYLFCHAMRN